MSQEPSCAELRGSVRAPWGRPSAGSLQGSQGVPCRASSRLESKPVQRPPQRLLVLGRVSAGPAHS